MRYLYPWLSFSLLFIVVGCTLELPADKELRTCSKPAEIIIGSEAANAQKVTMSLRGEVSDVASVLWRITKGSTEVHRSQSLTVSNLSYSYSLPELGSYDVFAEVKTICGETITLAKNYKTCLKPADITITNDASANVLKIQVALTGSLTDVTTVLWRVNNSNNTEVVRSQELTVGSSNITLTLPATGSYTVLADVKTACGETVQLSKAHTTRLCFKPTALIPTADAANPLTLSLALSGNTSDISGIIWKVTNSSNVETAVNKNGLVATVTLPAYGVYTLSATATTLCGESVPLSTSYTASGLYPEPIFVQGGTFEMGSATGEMNEQPVHNVTLSSYWISKHEVTVKQYREFCNASGYAFPTDMPAWGWQDDNPIVFVNWNDATAYCAWLSQKTGKKYRLPTEAEWEFAAKGGNLTQRYLYAGSNSLDDVAWYYKNSGDRTHSVGTKKPNELGLYDMSGNVWEWNQDWFAFYPSGSVVNPQGGVTGVSRSLRSGAFDGNENGRITFRLAYYPVDKCRCAGFRCVMEN
ncbi:MAG: formylglycine-generating enzyme family protein [Spirosomataceae bacterium]